MPCAFSRPPRGGIERRRHGFPRFRSLHAGEQAIELRGKIVEIREARTHQRLEFRIGDEHGLGRVVLRDRYRAPEGSFFENRAEFVLEPAGGDGGQGDEFTLAVAVGERGHGRPPGEIMAIIAQWALLDSPTSPGGFRDDPPGHCFFFRRDRRTTSGMRRMRRNTCARCMRFLTWMVKTMVV